MGRKRTRAANPVEDGDLSLAARAAWLSYIGGYTQRQIADRLRVSQAKAHRLIAEAHRCGMVKVFVQGVPSECTALEDAITAAFKLQSCIVAPSLANGRKATPDASPFAAVGAAGARLLHHFLTAQKVKTIGVGKGRTLAAVVDHMPEIHRPDLKIVAVSGSLNRNLAANPLDIVLRLAERTAGQGYFLPVPYLAASPEEKQVLLAQKSVGDMLALARQADLILVGIGSLEADAHVKQIGMVSDKEWSELQAKGAVGDLMGSFVDIDGQPVGADINRLAVGLGLAEMRGRRVVALAGGATKAEAILAALRTGAVSDLITDEEAATRIAALLKTTEKPHAQGAKGRAA
ncbi:MAG: sugar-binding transcriptional regulator [Rhodospirillales bacterium]|nr:sugar-binding transcriptional regulator [Rhodospirillales bacterium]